MNQKEFGAPCFRETQIIMHFFSHRNQTHSGYIKSIACGRFIFNYKPIQTALVFRFLLSTWPVWPVGIHHITGGFT